MTTGHNFIGLNFGIILTFIIYIFSYFAQLDLLKLNITEAAEGGKYGGIYKGNGRSNGVMNQTLFPIYDNETSIYKIFDDANKISIKTLGKEDLSFKISKNELYQKAHILFILAKIASHQLPVIDGIDMGHIAFSPLPQASQSMKIYDIVNEASINTNLFLHNINENNNIFIEESSLVLSYKADGFFYDSLTGKILGRVQLKKFYNTLDKNLIPKIENALYDYKEEADLLIVNLNLSDNINGRAEYLFKQLNELNKNSQIPLIFGDCSYI